MGKCLDLRGLPRLVNDQLINIVSVLQLVYTHLPQGRDRKQCCEGGYTGGDGSKQREKIEKTSRGQDAGTRNSFSGLVNFFFFSAQTATANSKGGHEILCAVSGGTSEEEGGEKENTEKHGRG